MTVHPIERSPHDGTCARIPRLPADLDRAAVSAAWEEALAAPVWEGPPVWLHGDLDSRNLLARDGRLSAVIDFGAVSTGDSAADIMVAWKMLTAKTRRIFQATLAVDEATWVRARGWALSQAVMALSYYTPENNKVLVAEARRWIHEVLADGGHDKRS